MHFSDDKMAMKDSTAEDHSQGDYIELRKNVCSEAKGAVSGFATLSRLQCSLHNVARTLLVLDGSRS